MHPEPSSLPDPKLHDPLSASMTPIVFQKIKNHLLNDYSATEPGRFTYYLQYDQDHFWKLISEKNPIPRGLDLRGLDKANIIWERLAQEPSPRRLIELCQAVADHINFVQYLPATERIAPMYFADCMHDAFIREVYSAFLAHGREALLMLEASKYDPSFDEYISYIGNDFGAEESEYFITNIFNSEVINAAIAAKSQNAIKRRWGLSKISPKLKLPGFEIGAEVEKK